MQIPTKIIETPVGKHKVEIKEWITGRDREYINEPMYNAVQTKPRVIAGKPDVEFGKFDVQGFITESGHREIEKFVVSIDGNKEKVLEAVLDMHESDYEFIKDAIEAIGKKKETLTS
jgi:hypothetical protein